jgi:hypothetical protein
MIVAIPIVSVALVVVMIVVAMIVVVEARADVNVSEWDSHVFNINI